MSTTLLPTVGIPPEPARPWTVAEYHALLRDGGLVDGDAFELLEGWLLPKTIQGPSHNFVVATLNQRLHQSLVSPWIVRSQLAITTDDSEPEPDLCIVRGTHAQFVKQHPTSRDVVLVVEVSDSSLQRDRDIKQRIYARAGIAEYWIVNLVERQIEVHTLPQSAGESPIFAQRLIYRPSQAVPVTLDGTKTLEFAVSELLPPA